MAEVIFMPRLSDTMVVGTVVKWHKKIGEKILEGDILAEIETDKAIQELEAEYNSTLLYIGIKEGESAPVNSVLAILGSENEDISSLLKQNKINNNYKRIFISPLAKKLAFDKGILLDNIKGTGINGRIIKKDIERYLDDKKSSNEVNHSNIRKIISKRLINSKIESPHYSLFIEVIMDNLIKLRDSINEKKYLDKISFNDLIVKASALAIKENPKINSSWTEKSILYHNNINIGIAVALEDGLIVPVINQVDEKSLRQISFEIKEKVIKAKEKKIKSNELEGSTFTVSNLGMFGIDSFTSIINQPNSCILSVGSIKKKPIINNDKIVIGNTTKLTLTCDHRIIDGAVGSDYLKSLKHLLQEPLNIII
ncbi:Dihydrolipoamide acetyltransferase component of pyruvate dehydrogenase complex [Candidatus Karelsulcia muelleri]|uniref:Dihydrolipoamide acetyltransferase component of pyruvate dehydrogenase complex n=1 Tax=Candidatus Karelsulcia muelleri TaxID=336810 RepID=A0A654M433_9FLAO|nr:dihydrolipoamide acetyltransferase family protein [Candidatus Karelsulcia muelleri]AGS33474.1 Dihydrolipoamide acetyltransferase component of pyruvate dehydrogenase complex [Candidatus Karelsulcia muelleri str. Sulcia-ALF]ALP70216.1 Dihydrolipoamide acetyltransferase component of pyruvate dehydrogenase complex [Candidatus Karelsulcia muelleri]QND78462.1 Dihydrolipoamide acyltransferase E2 component [Candidatus Karelsulcia muelleri]